MDEGITAARRRNFAVPLGCMLVALGVALSGTLLESTLLPAGTIVGTTRRAAALSVCQIMLLVMGSYLLVRRPRITTVHLSMFGLVALLAGIVGIVLLQIAFVPPAVPSGWRSFAPAIEHNELGFRGQRIEYSPDDHVIILLGDSQVEATAMSFGVMPERRLETHLGSRGKKARVFSIGAGGYGQDQELLALQEFFEKYRADVVVLWQTPRNDVWNNVFKTHMVNRNPKPTFWLDDRQQLHGPSEALGQSIADSPIVAAALWQLALGLPWRDRSWERSLPRPYVPLDHYDGPVRTEWQERWNENLGGMREENLATEKSHLAVMLAPRSERMQYGLDLTRALTQRILQLATDNKSKFLVFRTDTHDFDSEHDQVYVLNGKFYRVSKRQFLANWDYVNSGFDAQVIPVTVKDWRVSLEDGHLNAQATDQVMADLAERLRTRIADKQSPGVNAPEAHLGLGKP